MARCRVVMLYAYGLEDMCCGLEPGHKGRHRFWAPECVLEWEPTVVDSLCDHNH